MPELSDDDKRGIAQCEERFKELLDVGCALQSDLVIGSAECGAYLLNLVKRLTDESK